MRYVGYTIYPGCFFFLILCKAFSNISKSLSCLRAVFPPFSIMLIWCVKNRLGNVTRSWQHCSLQEPATKETVLLAQILKLRARRKTWVAWRVLISCSGPAWAKSVRYYQHGLSDTSRPSKLGRIPCQCAALRTTLSSVLSTWNDLTSRSVSSSTFSSNFSSFTCRRKVL